MAFEKPGIGKILALVFVVVILALGITLAVKGAQGKLGAFLTKLGCNCGPLRDLGSGFRDFAFFKQRGDHNQGVTKRSAEMENTRIGKGRLGVEKENKMRGPLGAAVSPKQMPLRLGVGATELAGVENMTLEQAYDGQTKIVNNDVPMSEEIHQIMQEVQEGTGPLVTQPYTREMMGDEEVVSYNGTVLNGKYSDKVVNPSSNMMQAYGVDKLTDVEMPETLDDPRNGYIYNNNTTMQNSLALEQAYEGYSREHFDDPAFDGAALMDAAIYKGPTEPETKPKAATYPDLLRGPPGPFDLDNDGEIDEFAGGDFPAQFPVTA
jgi:hypothetical protein